MTNKYLEEIIKEFTNRVMPFSVYPMGITFTASQEQIIIEFGNRIMSIIQEELAKLEDKNNELWEDGYSFGKYKCKETIIK